MQHFALAGTYRLSIDRVGSDRGQVRINSIHLDERTEGVKGTPYPWVGRYFQDVPVELEATPAKCFSHWEGDARRSNLIHVKPRVDMALKAVFLEGCRAD
ncbi:MAG: hypothetical protein C0453_16475 [Comamonadaceae bacterium]|nr:hypothetical protein [Comamonadaceae bacterium]